MTRSPLYREVAVAVDGSERALDAIGPARRIAEAHGAGLSLVTVAAPGARADAEAAVQRALEAVGEPVPTTIVDHDDPGEALGRFDDEQPETLLCLTTRGRRPALRGLLGSVATAVVAHSGQAVALVGPRCDLESRPIRRLVACLDGSEEGEAILPWATRWSSAADLRLVLVHVVYPLPPPVTRLPPTDRQMDELGYLREVVRRLDDIGHDALDMLVQHADAPRAIADIVGDLPGSVVAAASTDRHPFTEVFAASTTAQVLRTSTAPVLVASRP